MVLPKYLKYFLFSSFFPKSGFSNFNFSITFLKINDKTYEVVNVCEAWGLDKDAYIFNVVKYVARAGKKDSDKELQDLKKALWYLERKINNLEKNN